MSASTPRPGSGRPKKAAGSRSTSRTNGGGTSRKATSRKATKPALTGKERLRKALKYTLIAGLVCMLALVAMFYVAYRATDIPSPNAAFQAQTTNVYYAGGKTKIGRFATQNRESIPLADIPKVMQDAAVAAEDRTFWTNKGIDPKGILRAAFSNAKGGATQGASTITQQYVKILYLTQERTFKRKIKEAFLSLKIHNDRSKSEILEGYLNTIYFGRGAYGVQAAANAYFGIPAKELNASQSAMLAAVLNSPNYLSPDRSEASREALLRRYDYVVSGMASMGAIPESDAAKISETLPKVKKATTNNLYGGQRGFMLDMVKAELLKLGFDDSEIQGGGLKVTTTFTKKAMDAAKTAVDEVAPDVPKLHPAVASVDVQTGAVLGFYAGQDYLKSQINWATTALPPGSAFKPFAVAAGIKDGFSLKDTFDGNSPYRFPDGSTVVNEGEGTGENFGSHVSLTMATQKSINTAFVDMTEAMDNGPRKIATMAEKLGVPPLKDDMVNARISLGGSPVSPLNLANAYAGIADGGLHHSPFVITKVIRASDGEVLYTAPRKTDRVLDEDIAADTSYAMQQVVKSGTGAYVGRNLGRPAAGKTGTATNDDKRVITSWFGGFTPQVATAVAYSHGTGYKPIDEGYLPRGYFGATYPAETWTAAMKLIMEGMDVEQFPPPANVDGEAPSSGHAPYTPPPPPTKTKKPKPTPTPPATTKQPGPPSTPPGHITESPSPTCTLLDCPSPSNGNGGGGGGGARVASYDGYYARQESVA